MDQLCRPDRSHARNQDSLGSDFSCHHDRADDDMDCDAMDGVAPCLSGPAWKALDADRQCPAVSAAGLLLVVVLLRCLCARDLCGRRIHRGIRWLRGGCHSYRDVGMARAGGKGGADLWLGTLGHAKRDPGGGLVEPRWRGAWAVGSQLSSS